MQKSVVFHIYVEDPQEFRSRANPTRFPMVGIAWFVTSMSEHIFTNQLFGKLKAIGTSIENVAVNVGGTVASAGTKVVGVVKDIPNQITYNSDFEHIRSINELARQKPERKEHKYTEQEWEEADKRADKVLDKLYPGYFEDNFDPVKYELEQLTSDSGQEEIDSIVEKLTYGVEVSPKE
jgi:hypothetical protein